MSSTKRVEKVYVLYGSQTGNSEQAAKDLAFQVPTRLSAAAIQELTGTKDEVTVVAKHMQLDDFLEIERAQWTRLIVIITSSYGVGQAPLGCYRFRQLCDAWKKQDDNNKSLLKGVHFALCGLGDSKFDTFFENPTVLDEALHLVGAQRVGSLGKADASVDDLGQVIETWRESIWTELAKVVAAEPTLDAAALGEMQRQTVALCRSINPDFDLATQPKSEFRLNSPVSVVIGAVAVVIGYYCLARDSVM